MSQTNQPTIQNIFQKIKSGQNVQVQVAPNINAIFSKQEVAPEDDTTRMCFTVREALEIAYQLHNEDQPGGVIYDLLNQEELENSVEISPDVKDRVSSMISYFGLALFEKKLEDSENMSPWSQAISKLIAVPDRKLMRLQIPLCVTLPRFHKLDLIKSRVSSCHESVPNDFTITIDQWEGDRKHANLQAVEAFEERNSRRHVKTYCFTTITSESYPLHRPIFTYSINAEHTEHVNLFDFHFNSGNILKCKIAAQSEPFIGKFLAMKITNIELV